MFYISEPHYIRKDFFFGVYASGHGPLRFPNGGIGSGLL
jgi:hypothetical protein